MLKLTKCLRLIFEKHFRLVILLFPSLLEDYLSWGPWAEESSSLPAFPPILCSSHLSHNRNTEMQDFQVFEPNMINFFEDVGSTVVVWLLTKLRMRKSLIVISWISEKILSQLESLYSPLQIHQVTPLFRISLAFEQYSGTGLFPPIFTNLAWPYFTRSAYLICLEKRYSWLKWTMGYNFLLCRLGFVILSY